MSVHGNLLIDVVAGIGTVITENTVQAECVGA